MERSKRRLWVAVVAHFLATDLWQFLFMNTSLPGPVADAIGLPLMMVTLIFLGDAWIDVRYRWRLNFRDVRIWIGILLGSLLCFVLRWLQYKLWARLGFP